MPAPLTMDKILADLEPRQIELIEYAGNVNDHSRFGCLVEGCGYEWETRLNNIRSHGSGCPDCGGNRRWTVEEIQADLVGRQIELVDYGGNVQGRSTFRCMVEGCDHEWPTTFNHIHNSASGCPRCAGNLPLTVEEIKTDLTPRSIELVDYGGNIHARSKFRCLVDGCGDRWETTVHSVRGGTGCPACGQRLVADAQRTPIEVLEAALEPRNIELIEYGGNTNARSNFRCSEGHQWSTTVGSVISAGTGCPECCPIRPVTVDEIRAELEPRGIELVEYAGTVLGHSWFRCDEGHEWFTRVAHVRDGSGCPTCVTRGLDPNAPALLYLICHKALGAIKVGVTGTEVTTDRLALHRRLGWELIERWDYSTGAEAYDVEQLVLDWWRAEGLPVEVVAQGDMPQGGWTETTSLAFVDVAEVVRFIRAVR